MLIVDDNLLYSSFDLIIIYNHFIRWILSFTYLSLRYQRSPSINKNSQTIFLWPLVCNQIRIDWVIIKLTKFKITKGGFFIDPKWNCFHFEFRQSVRFLLLLGIVNCVRLTFFLNLFIQIDSNEWASYCEMQFTLIDIFRFLDEIESIIPIKTVRII